MKPEADKYISTMAGSLLMNFMPSLCTHMEKKTMTQMAFVMMAAAEEFDRAASRRIEENQHLRRLFSEAVPVVRDQGLIERLEKASNSTEEDFKVSALDKINQEFRALFIDLHRHVETIENEKAAALEKKLWIELAASVKRREYALWTPL
jgi:hypothetical protein